MVVIKIKIRSLLIIPLLLSVTACDSPPPVEGRVIQTQSGESIIRPHNESQIAAGAVIFQRDCAQCHGINGEGHPDWRKRDADGMYPPPPLNGTGHAWHHPTTFLQDRIKNGSEVGQGKMPAWDGKISDDEIDAVIAWFQAQWPDELYAVWYEINQRALKR